MSDIENLFHETIRKHFPSDGNVQIAPDLYCGVGESLGWLKARVTIRGTDVRPYDEFALLKELEGSIVQSNDKGVVIEGKFRHQTCRVTITSAA